MTQGMNQKLDPRFVSLVCPNPCFFREVQSTVKLVHLAQDVDRVFLLCIEWLLSHHGGTRDEKDLVLPQDVLTREKKKKKKKKETYFFLHVFSHDRLVYFIA
jgi:hypothetical protein